jgi:hypothetical protein
LDLQGNTHKQEQSERVMVEGMIPEQVAQFHQG